MSEDPEPSLPPAVPVPKRSSPNGCFTTLAILGIGSVVLAAFWLPVFRRGGEPARRTQCKHNLKQIALALHLYEERYHALPPAYTVDHYGHPLHSWRTLILPYLDQQPLYDTIDLSIPWDDPANSKAFDTPVPIFMCPSANRPRNHTTYLASVAPNGCFRRAEPRSLSEITDDTSETLMLIEVPSEQSVLWMSPNDADETLVLSIGPDSKTAHTGGTQAALCDGSVRFLSTDLSAAARRALISIAEGDTVGEF